MYYIHYIQGVPEPIPVFSVDGASQNPKYRIWRDICIRVVLAGLLPMSYEASGNNIIRINGGWVLEDKKGRPPPFLLYHLGFESWSHTNPNPNLISPLLLYILYVYAIIIIIISSSSIFSFCISHYHIEKIRVGLCSIMSHPL